MRKKQKSALRPTHNMMLDLAVVVEFKGDIMEKLGPLVPHRLLQNGNTEVVVHGSVNMRLMSVEHGISIITADAESVGEIVKTTVIKSESPKSIPIRYP